MVAKLQRFMQRRVLTITEDHVQVANIFQNSRNARVMKVTIIRKSSAKYGIVDAKIMKEILEVDILIMIIRSIFSPGMFELAICLAFNFNDMQ